MDASRQPKRLIDLYRPGDPVQIYLADWQSGRVVAHQPPAVWVELSNGTRWFVTNGRHIRPEPPAHEN